jgi:hypothetical protein
MEMFGKISCLKYHLAKILGNEVGICPISTPEIVHIANQSIFYMNRNGDQREEMKLELANRHASTSEVGKANPQVGIPQYLAPQHPHLSLC